MTKFFKDWVMPVVIALFIVFLINKYVFFNIEVPTESMVPAIKVGDRIMSLRVHDASKLKRGDIVVFKSEELGDLLVKRLIGLPNDKIDIKDGIVYINGTKLDEPYVHHPDTLSGTYSVPEDCYFFLGDNRASSYDARKWNNPYINKQYIRGRAAFRIWPFSRFGEMK